MSTGPFAGQRVTLCGDFVALTHAQLARSRLLAGAQVRSHLSRRTQVVIVGERRWRERHGRALCCPASRARQWQQAGHAIEVLSLADAMRRGDPSPNPVPSTQDARR